jgi:hypothetical protein
MKLQDIRQDIRNIDKDHLLGLLGLETKRSPSRRLLGMLGTFGAGVLVGAGVALLLAPKAGGELRRDIRAKLGRDGKENSARPRGQVDAGQTANRGA